MRAIPQKPNPIKKINSLILVLMSSERATNNGRARFISGGNLTPFLNSLLKKNYGLYVRKKTLTDDDPRILQVSIFDISDTPAD